MTIAEIIAVGIFLVIVSYQDIRNREIDLMICMVFGGIGIIINLITGWQNDNTLTNMLLAMVPGVGLLIISRLTNQSIGMGDGVVVLVLGTFFGIEKTTEALLLGLVMTALLSLVLLITKRVKKEYEFPLIPFLSIATFLVLGGY